LVKLKVPEILEDNGRHRHAQGAEVILRRHFFLPRRIHQETNQAARQILRAARGVKLNSNLFAIGHLPEIDKIGAHDRHAVGARKVRNSTAAGGGRIGHDRNRRALEQSG